MKLERRMIKGLVALLVVLPLISCGGTGGVGSGLDSSGTSIGADAGSSDASASSSTTSKRTRTSRTSTSSGDTTTTTTSSSGGGSSGTTTSSGSGTTGGSSAGGTIPPVDGGTYDNRVGLGSDANGIPILEKHANARYIYWNPSHPSASDSNPGTSESAPKATLRSAWEALRNSTGDWLLMAQGAVSSNGFNGSLPNRSGLSTSYPIVVTTYNPADPTVMRQGASAILGGTATSSSQGISLYNFTGQNIVFENIDLTYNGSLGASFSGLEVLTFPGSAHTFNILFHNIRLTRFQATVQSGETQGTSVANVIFRHCAFSYSAAQGMYLRGTDGVTIEDSVYYHNGWSADGTRDTATQAPNIFDHNAYFADRTWNTIFRRNVSGHASSHGLQLRGGGIAHDNVFASNPINFLIGGGDDYNVNRPNGVPYDARRNVIVGSSNISTSEPRGFGVLFENTQDGGTFDNNLIVNIGPLSSGNRMAFVTTWLSGQFNMPTYINLTNNIMWNWSNDENLAWTLAYRTYPNQLHLSYYDNVIEFDAKPISTNRNTPSTPFPEPGRTIASYATANGYANEDALWPAMLAKPKAGWAKSIGNYIRAGYGR